ncbi:MAG: hypothetical protein KC589_06795 [Nanoarchaeota archaeon]|nr:hypothetical protein [Nanoarchaeota archaeon]
MENQILENLRRNFPDLEFKITNTRKPETGVSRLIWEDISKETAQEIAPLIIDILAKESFYYSYNPETRVMIIEYRPITNNQQLLEESYIIDSNQD